jgi:hypothetical protein
MSPRRCNATRRAAAAVAQQRGRRLRLPGGRGESSGGGNGGSEASHQDRGRHAPTAIDTPAIRIVASDASRSLGRARHRVPSAPGRRAPSPRKRRYPDGSNAGDVVKARSGDPVHQRRGQHRREAAAFKQGMDLPQFGATHDRRVELRASRGSCQRRQRAPSPRTSPA